MEQIFLYFLPFSGADPSSWIQDPDSEWDGPGSGQHRTEHTHSVSVKKILFGSSLTSTTETLDF